MTDAAKAARPTRRVFLLGGTVVVAGSGLFASKWFNIFADASTEGALTVETALAEAEAGSIYLIDIRRPDEWQRTGVAEPAIPLDMRRDDFETVLQSIFEANGERPVALICARGVRSDRMNQRLEAAGFTNVLDVPEGMLGSGAGPGYLKRGLPIRPPTEDELAGTVG
ncbi:MAG: rhodanese-like domain-containing protein [Pseudomonadota bacterium]